MLQVSGKQYLYMHIQDRLIENNIKYLNVNKNLNKTYTEFCSVKACGEPPPPKQSKEKSTHSTLTS